MKEPILITADGSQHREFEPMHIGRKTKKSVFLYISMENVVHKLTERILIKINFEVVQTNNYDVDKGKQMLG